MKIRTYSLAMLALIAGPALAQGLPDPTRPPAMIESTPTSAAPSGLQSIIHRQGAKPAAVINGVFVELGGKVGEATLERVGEVSVGLRSAMGRETLYLTPGVGKKITSTDSSAAKRPRGKLEKARP